MEVNRHLPSHPVVIDAVDEQLQELLAFDYGHRFSEIIEAT